MDRRHACRHPPIGCRLMIDRIARTLDAVQKYDGISRQKAEAMLAHGKLQAFAVGEESIIIAGMDIDGWTHIFAAAGDLHELTAALPRLEEWYKARGARLLTIDGREGWLRVLRSQGYARNGDRLEKGLADA